MASMSGSEWKIGKQTEEYALRFASFCQSYKIGMKSGTRIERMQIIG